MSGNRNVLSLEWVFGFSRDVAIHNLCDENRNAIFYVSAHTGVIYDLTSKKQRLLQGHCNPISSTCVSADRRWIATADHGNDSMIVVWDSYSGAPVKTIPNPHMQGVRVMDMSPDANYIVTLSEEDQPQVLSIWDCSCQLDTPLHSAQVGASTSDDAVETQICVRFDPSDATSIISNGASVAIFWSWREGVLSYYAPPLGERDFKQPVGALTQSLFIPGTRRAVSATADGDAVLWDTVELPEVASTDRRATKLIKLHSGALLYMTTTGDNEGMLVTGAADGHVRFFDFHFRVVAWFEDLDAGPVTSISFAHQPAASQPAGGTPFSCPDFIVGTANALVVACQASMFEQLRADARRGTLLVQGQDAPVHGLASHPSLSRFACTGHSGLLQLWDYADRRLLLMRMFDKMLGHCLAFSPNGKLLAVGFTNGTVKLLAGMTLEELATWRVSRECITQLAFSHDTSVLASADADRCVAIYRHGAALDEGSKKEWEFLGKYRAHYQAISGLQFGEGIDGAPRLVSIGEDRQLVEYDLQRSSVSGGVQLRKAVRVEQTATPTSCLWLASEQRGEPCVVCANDAYKLRLVVADSKTVVQTVLGPTYGGAITRMLLIPTEHGSHKEFEYEAETSLANQKPRYLAYACSEKVVGLIQLPLDGNPNKGMGLIAHPSDVSGLCASWDGRWLITAGGSDLSLHLWQVDVSALEPTISAGGGGVTPFVALLEGGASGAFYQEIVDYFYYAQLRAQGEDTTSSRRITGRVPINELGNLMRALGFYPSERAIEDVMHEARTDQQAMGGEDSVGFDEFVRLYVNHRPVFGVGKAHISDAFAALGAEGTTGGISRDALLRVLQNQGETLAGDDLSQCLRALVGTDDLELISGRQLNAKMFAEDVLGFEDYTGVSNDPA